MSAVLPPQLVEADAALARVQLRLSASHFLNPINEVEARERFRAGHGLALRYHPLSTAAELLRDCDRIRPPLDHPLGREVAAARDELIFSIRALEQRTASAFDALGLACGWLEEPGPRLAVDHPVRASDDEVVSVSLLTQALTEALRVRGFTRWQVSLDPVMTARVLVDSPRRMVRVNPRAVVTRTDIRALVAHEVGVHVTRSERGSVQALQLFRNGLAGSLVTEEGLALLAESEAVGLAAGSEERLALISAAAVRARERGFTELVRSLEPLVGAGTAWAVGLRVKRGLANPEEPGAYAKDRVYWLGLTRVSAWRAAGGELESLFVGKVGMHHPVAEWQRSGWLH